MSKKNKIILIRTPNLYENNDGNVIIFNVDYDEAALLHLLFLCHDC